MKNTKVENMSKFNKQVLEREHPTRKKTWKILRVAQKQSFLHSNPPSAETPQQMAQYHSLTDFVFTKLDF